MIKKLFREYATVTLGALILALVFNAILLPLEIVTGGSTGLSIIGSHFFNISPSLIVLICYLGALIFGWLLLGKKKIKKSILGTLSYLLFIYLTSPLTDVVKSLAHCNSRCFC